MSTDGRENGAFEIESVRTSTNNVTKRNISSSNVEINVEKNADNQDTKKVGLQRTVGLAGGVSMIIGTMIGLISFLV